MDTTKILRDNKTDLSVISNMKASAIVLSILMLYAIVYYFNNTYVSVVIWLISSAMIILLMYVLLLEDTCKAPEIVMVKTLYSLSDAELLKVIKGDTLSPETRYRVMSEVGNIPMLCSNFSTYYCLSVFIVGSIWHPTYFRKALFRINGVNYLRMMSL